MNSIESDRFRQSDINGSDYRNPNKSDSRKMLEVQGYHRIPVVGFLSDPTIGSCRKT